MKRVLVTGAGGFIGRHALAPLAQRGFEVHGVTRADADLLDVRAARALVDRVRPTHLLHLAWYVEHGRFWSAPENFPWVGATVALLDAFAGAGGQRAVVAGTCAEYDWSGGVCDERSTPLAPQSVYGVCKHATRLVAQALCAARGIGFAWGRIFHNYGPGEAPARLVSSVIRALLNGEPARLTHGAQRRDFLHVADVAAGFAALVDSPVEGAVNVAANEPTTLRAVAERIGAQLGRGELLQFGALPAPEGEPAAILAAGERLRREARWRPRYDLDAGLADAIDWWRHHGA